jgi:hypothetical protein
MNESKSSLRGSIFARARQSFFRSKGERGANVETLRGLTGADFEGSCKVTCGNRSPLFACFGSNNNEVNRQRYVLIKGPNLFVFANAESSAPKYALDVVHKKVTLHPLVGKTQLVTFESGLGDVDYKFLFDLRDNSDVAKNFSQALKEQIAAGETDEVKEKLGHRDQMMHSKSVNYATTVAAKKKKDQPEVPISASEIFANDPSAMVY